MVVAVLVTGSEKAAAHRLCLSPSTVKHHVANAPSKVGAETAAQNASTAAAQASRVAVSLRNLYVLSYAPSNAARDGKLRNVQVQIVQPRGLPPLTVRHRMGYFAR